MTTNSTKYFCNRGALSARFILVDTPLRGEYYYDGEHGKYYFGARYFDPFFGMWMSPDPAGQFANPYTYGGDPLNYVDLYGLWSIGFGFTIGWENGGFTAGVGVALDIGSNQLGVDLKLGAYHNFGNGSNTVSANAGVAVNIGIVGVGANLGYAYNTLSGGTLSYGIRGSICGEIGRAHV